MTLKYRFKISSETHERISTLEAAKERHQLSSSFLPFTLQHHHPSVHLAVGPPSVSLPFFTREALGVGCWQGKGAVRGRWAGMGGEGWVSRGFLEEGKLKMGVGGKDALQAAGVQDPWGLGGSGEGRGGIWLCSDPPTWPSHFAHTWWGSRAIWWPMGRLQGRSCEGSPGGLGLSEDSPRSSQCPGSHPPSPAM